MSFGGRSSAFLRSLLALLLVGAQILAAAHAVGHVGEWSAFARSGAAASATQPDYGGGVPDAERRANCLLCLATADLSSALPSTPALPILVSLPSAAGGALFPAPAPRRLPCPRSRGPPLPPV